MAKLLLVWSSQCATGMKNRIQRNEKDNQNVFPCSQVSCNDFPVLPLHVIFLYICKRPTNQKKRKKKQKCDEKKTIWLHWRRQKMVTRKQMWTLNRENNTDDGASAAVSDTVPLWLFSTIFICNAWRSFALLVCCTLPFSYHLTTNSLKPIPCGIC